VDEVVSNTIKSIVMAIPVLYENKHCSIIINCTEYFSINRIFMKLFHTGSVASVEDCQRFLNFLPASYQVDVKTANFFAKTQSVRKQNL